MNKKAVGFTAKQRRWFLDRDDHQCMFWMFVGGKWVRCRNTEYLQIHHVVPRGYASLHYPRGFELNGPYQGLTVCSIHHVGYGVNGDYRYVIHPDNEPARLAYTKGDKQAYAKMMDVRRGLNAQGLPYWNTTWDHMFQRLVDKANDRYLSDHPYPKHRKYGNRGR